MAIPIVMPRLGMTMTEGRVVEWPFDPGTPVGQGEIVLIIESDKSEVEVEASGGGTFAEIFVEIDEEVPCGTLLGVITQDSDQEFDAVAFREQWERDNPIEEADGASGDIGEPVASEPAATSTPGADDPVQSPAAQASARRAITPAARKRARELDVAIEQVAGSGPGGRVRRRDIEATAARRENLREVAGGVRLEMRSEGSGPDVALLPGFGTDFSAFSAQLPALGADYRLHGVNPRGIGLSDAPVEEAYAVAQAADDVAELLSAPAHLVGTSLGTAVAIETARRHPEKVLSLALLAPLLEVGPLLSSVTQSWCAVAESGDARLLAETLLPWFLGPATLADEKARTRIQRGLPATLASASSAALQRTRAGLLAWSGHPASELSRIQVPTLVIYGECDLLAPDGAAFAAAIPHAEVLALPKAGHAVGIEAASEVNEALLRHLAAATN